MNNFIQTSRLAGKIPLGYRFFKSIDFPKLFPANVVFVTTHRCNSQCKTCNIWKTQIKNPEKAKKELTLEEYEKIFETIGNPYWVTIGGGEPFLRNDIDKLIISLYRIAHPAFINIASNASLPELIFNKVRNILEKCKRIKLILNLSLDHINNQNDAIRGTEGSFKLILDTVKRLKEIKRENFTLGIHTVISKYNYKDFAHIYNYVDKFLSPDSFIIENAQIRHEFMNDDADVFVENEELIKVINFFMSQMNRRKYKKTGKLIKAFRMAYYSSLKYFLQKGQMPYKCFAGFCSCQIDPFGEIQACAIKNYFMGNLREKNYNFKELWRSREARNARRAIKIANCSCALANVSYTNMLIDAKSTSKIIWNLLRLK